jgi:hypothetical protein
MVDCSGFRNSEIRDQEELTQRNTEKHRVTQSGVTHPAPHTSHLTPHASRRTPPAASLPPQAILLNRHLEDPFSRTDNKVVLIDFNIGDRDLVLRDLNFHPLIITVVCKNIFRIG